MRTVLTLALLLSVAAPVSAQRYARRGTYYSGNYVSSRVAYSYSPVAHQSYSTVTYGHPIYSTPTYSSPPVVYSTPVTAYSTSPTVYSQPTYSPAGYSRPIYSPPVTSYSAPTVVYSQPIYSQPTPPTYGWSQPGYGTWTAQTYQTTRFYPSNYSNTFPTSGTVLQDNLIIRPTTQPAWTYVPSGDFNRRLMTVPVRPGYAQGVPNVYVR